MEFIRRAQDKLASIEGQLDSAVVPTRGVPVEGDEPVSAPAAEPEEPSDNADASLTQRLGAVQAHCKRLEARVQTKTECGLRAPHGCV